MMVSELIKEFLINVRWDIATTLILTIVLFISLMYRRHKINKVLKSEGKQLREVLVGMDALYSLATATTIYGGVAAAWYAVSGKLLFNQQFIISQEYMIAAAGIVLVVLGLLAYKQGIKDIKEST